MFSPRLTGSSISKAPKLLKVSAGTQMRHFQLVGLKPLVWPLQADRNCAREEERRTTCERSAPRSRSRLERVLHSSRSSNRIHTAFWWSMKTHQGTCRSSPSSSLFSPGTYVLSSELTTTEPTARSHLLDRCGVKSLARKTKTEVNVASELLLRLARQNNLSRRIYSHRFTETAGENARWTNKWELASIWCSRRLS